MLVRFTRGVGLCGWIVRAATWSEFAHVGFKLDDGLVLDATPEFGVAIREAQDDATTTYFRADVDGLETVALNWAMRQIGRPYDWTAIYGMALRRDWHRDNKWFCSELVEGAFSFAGRPLVRDGHKLDRITPRDLLLSTRLTEMGR